MGRSRELPLWVMKTTPGAHFAGEGSMKNPLLPLLSHSRVQPFPSHCSQPSLGRGEDQKTPRNKAGSSSRVGISAEHPCLRALGYSLSSSQCDTSPGSVPREKPGMPPVTEHPANPSVLPRGWLSLPGNTKLDPMESCGHRIFPQVPEQSLWPAAPTPSSGTPSPEYFFSNSEIATTGIFYTSSSS